MEIEKKYKYITIKESEDLKNKLKSIHAVFVILNNKSQSELGYLFYYPQWKQYVFTQAQVNMIFNKECLLNIIDFIDYNDRQNKIVDEIMNKF